MSPSPEFTTVRRQSLSESVYRQLRQKIVNQELAAGTELPSERALTVMLGVNRGAVREAIKRLQQAGLVAVRQGGNHVVQNYLEQGGLELLPALLVDADGHINAAVARSIMALRATLAPEVAAAAADKGGARLADRLDAVLADMRGTARDLPRLQECALAFWSLLVNASGNIAYRLAFNSMSKTYRSAWKLLTRVLEAEFRDLENMQALADAVRRRDRDSAHACAVRHVAIGTREMDKVLRTYERTRGNA
jgi:GntR family transcriptional regulator, transcriptional repressor for pyruvate dehydrogenase complex